ncbi:hypothetical protein RFI_31908 [Reticulomyxa filosa]|uniref:Uncharacterized protein n=1 Tax=Reticulomyxa filosa TaxID=46433 RepID=X6LV56_RETFI|nr:hypothetical protein RFI_31908 [Reticulomyxa filosa]|eukprot:ETO05489.1 hypothetical protein RFI_31908 [Reticulomyxa filosa]
MIGRGSEMPKWEDDTLYQSSSLLVPEQKHSKEKEEQQQQQQQQQEQQRSHTQREPVATIEKRRKNKEKKTIKKKRRTTSQRCAGASARKVAPTSTATKQDLTRTVSNDVESHPAVPNLLNLRYVSFCPSILIVAWQTGARLPSTRFDVPSSSVVTDTNTTNFPSVSQRPVADSFDPSSYTYIYIYKQWNDLFFFSKYLKKLKKKKKKSPPPQSNETKATSSTMFSPQTGDTSRFIQSTIMSEVRRDMEQEHRQNQFIIVGPPPSSASAVSSPVTTNGETHIELHDAEQVLRQLSKLKHTHKHPVWVDMCCDRDTFEMIASHIRPKIHPLTTEDCVSRDCREKLEIFDHYLFICIRAPTYDRERTQRIAIIVFKTIILTYHEQPGIVMEETRKIIKTKVEALEHIVPMLGVNSQHELLKRFLNARSWLGIYRHRLSPKSILLDQLNNLEWRAFLQDVPEPYWRDINDHLSGMVDIIEVGLKKLESLQNLFVANVSLEMNQQSNILSEIASKMSVLSAVSLPATLVAGLWGMNVYVPFQLIEPSTWDPDLNVLGFLIVVTLMLIGSATTYTLIIRRGWLNSPALLFLLNFSNGKSISFCFLKKHFFHFKLQNKLIEKKNEKVLSVNKQKLFNTSFLNIDEQKTNTQGSRKNIRDLNKHLNEFICLHTTVEKFEKKNRKCKITDKIMTNQHQAFSIVNKKKTHLHNTTNNKKKSLKMDALLL